jgi:hypothetical protein
MADGDAESVDEDVPAISVIPVEKEAAPDSTISVDQCHVGEDVEDGADAPWDIPDETAASKAGRYKSATGLRRGCSRKLGQTSGWRRSRKAERAGRPAGE